MTDVIGPINLDAFRGVWQLDRDIVDANGGMSRFSGKAVFTPDGAGLLYEETGILEIPGVSPMQATRRYLWRESAGRIMVAFEDGRPFHSFDPCGTEAAAQHLCGADLYRVRYDFSAWPAWSALWQVAGPRKDYSMLGRYRRA